MAVEKVEKEDRDRLIKFMLITFFYLGFILINVVFNTGIIYIILLSISFLIILNWDKLPKKRKNVKLFGLQKDWIKDMFVGILAGIGLLLLSTISPFAFVGWATPDIPLANIPFLASTNQLMIVVGAAPIVEEITFSVVLFAILYIVLGLPFFWAVLVKSIIFAAYHITAYAGEIALQPVLSVSGDFLTALIASMVFMYIVKWTGSITSSIGSHGTFNAGSAVDKLVVFG